MDLLQNLIQKKKTEKDPVKKWVKRGDLEKEKEQKYLEEQARLEEERRKKQEEKERKAQAGVAVHTVSDLKAEKERKEREEREAKKLMLDPAVLASSETQEGEPKSFVPPVPKAEVVKALRKLGEPVTLFGESDAMRYVRWRKLEADREDGREKQNTFQEEMKAEDLELLVQAIEKRSSSAQTQPLLDMDLSDLEEEGKEGAEGEEPGRRSEEAQILSWMKKLMREWGEELQQRPEEVKLSAEGRVTTTQFRQCKRFLAPLWQQLKNHNAEPAVKEALVQIMRFCDERDYVKAHDVYLRLAIGNAPWPMGVTMVGIHERAGRTKIYSHQVAHILNDETQRKYIQAVKRLMTFCQRQYPADPSKSVLN
eukprot:GILI01032016.1.p1 GENE.GILI01032016.1~~GILI01032016.1.p1  ORF type:complete len:400 (+),score=110.59 GILI01032016.1:102-1202(+)